MDSFTPPKGELHSSVSVNLKGGEEGAKQSVENVVNLRPNISLRIHHIDVGQGEATLIEFRDNGKAVYTILIDGGRYTRGGGTIIRYLRKLKITTLNVMICTHHDADHVEGLLRILEDAELNKGKKAIQVECVIDRNPDLLSSSELHEGALDFPELEEESAGDGDRFDEPEIVKDEEEEQEQAKPVQIQLAEEDDDAEQLKKALTKFRKLAAGKKTLKLAPGTLLVESGTVPNFKMTCLHCDSEGTDEKQENNYSIAFLVQFGEFRYYTGGDLESFHEDKFLAVLTGGRHLCSFKCGHHGSKHSTSEKFLEQTKASHAVISCGRHSYYHPDAELVKRLCASSSLRWFDLTNCYYNRPGINPDYLLTEIVLLRKLLAELEQVSGNAETKVSEWLSEVNQRKGKDRVKATDVEKAAQTVGTLLGRIRGVQVAVGLVIGAANGLTGADDPGCEDVFEEVLKIAVQTADCNRKVGASSVMTTQMQRIQPGLFEVAAWTGKFESMRAAVRRVNTIAKSCTQVVQRFRGQKETPTDVKGYVAGGKGHLGTIVLDLTGPQAEVLDHQFAVGVYNGGWTWKAVRCLQTKDNVPAPLELPRDDLSGCVSIASLKNTNPLSPTNTWYEGVTLMDSIMDFSETTGASGSTVKKEPEPLSTDELSEQSKTAKFIEESQKLRARSRNRNDVAGQSCVLCGGDRSAGLTVVDCPQLTCQRPNALHRGCIKAKGFACQHCNYKDPNYK